MRQGRISQRADSEDIENKELESSSQRAESGSMVKFVNNQELKTCS